MITPGDEAGGNPIVNLPDNNGFVSTGVINPGGPNFNNTPVTFTSAGNIPLNFDNDTVTPQTADGFFNLKLTLGSAPTGPMAGTQAAFTDMVFDIKFEPGQGTLNIMGSDGSEVSQFITDNNSDWTVTSTDQLTSIILSSTDPIERLREFRVTGLQPFVPSPPPPVIPLPASFPLFASGLASLGLMGWRRKRKSPTSVLAA